MSNLDKASKVGDLLVESGLLSKEELQEGMDLSASLGLPIGKTMVMSGVLREKTVRAAVLLQSMLKDGLLKREMALKALSRSDTEGVPIEECLLDLGWRPLSDSLANKVGDLLVEAGVMSKGDLRDALEQVNTMGLSLGRVLVLTGKAKAAVVWCALNTQMFLRENKIDRKQALSVIRAVHERQTSFEQWLRVQGLAELSPESRIKLGELLVLSGMVAEEDILGAVEESVLKETTLGEVLVQQALISRERLTDALKLQEMTDNKSLTPLQAVDALRTIHNRNHSLQRAVAELGLLKEASSENLKLGELLKLCGWISEEDIDEAVALASKNSALLGKMLVAVGFIDETMMFNSLRCQFLVREGMLKRDEAIIALHFSQRMRCSIDQALIELGYTQKPVPDA